MNCLWLICLVAAVLLTVPIGSDSKKHGKQSKDVNVDEIIAKKSNVTTTTFQSTKNNNQKGKSKHNHDKESNKGSSRNIQPPEQEVNRQKSSKKKRVKSGIERDFENADFPQENNGTKQEPLKSVDDGHSVTAPSQDAHNKSLVHKQKERAHPLFDRADINPQQMVDVMDRIIPTSVQKQSSSSKLKGHPFKESSKLISESIQRSHKGSNRKHTANNVKDSKHKQNTTQTVADEQPVPKLKDKLLPMLDPRQQPLPGSEVTDEKHAIRENIKPLIDKGHLRGGAETIEGQQNIKDNLKPVMDPLPKPLPRVEVIDDEHKVREGIRLLMEPVQRPPGEEERANEPSVIRDSIRPILDPMQKPLPGPEVVDEAHVFRDTIKTFVDPLQNYYPMPEVMDKQNGSVQNKPKPLVDHLQLPGHSEGAAEQHATHLKEMVRPIVDPLQGPAANEDQVANMKEKIKPLVDPIQKSVGAPEVTAEEHVSSFKDISKPLADHIQSPLPQSAVANSS